MIEKKQFSQLLIAAAAAVVIAKPDSVGACVAFAFAVSLLAFEYFLDRSRTDDIADLKTYLDLEISKLKNKTDEMILKRRGQ